MRNLLWESFDVVISAAKGGDYKMVAEKVDSALNAAMETIADVLPTAKAPVLREGSVAAEEALTSLRSIGLVERLSPDYAAGRLAAAIDILSYSASATADENAMLKAKQQPYAQILDLLAEAPLRNTDIGLRLRKDKAYISRLLEDLRQMEVVVSQRQGRELYNALTPVGRLLVEEGVEQQHRAPLSQANVIALEPFNLGNLPSPAGVKPASLPPRLNLAS